MSRKTRNLLITLILLAAAAGVLAVVYFGSGDEPTVSEMQEPAEVVLTDFSPGSLRSVLIERDGGNLLFVSPDGETWSVAGTAEHYRPDTDRVETVIRGLSSMRSGDIAGGAAEDDEPAGFGLNPPSAAVVLKDREGYTRTVEIGNQNPAGTGYYARRSDSAAVVLLPRAAVEPLFLHSSVYRDMRLPAVNLESLTFLEYRSGGRTTRIEEEKGDDPYLTALSPLSVTSPWRGSYPLDDSGFRKIITEESPLPAFAAEYLDEADSGEPSLGLDPDISDYIHIRDSDENVLYLIIGSSDGRGSRYAMYGDREDAVFVLRESDLSILGTEPFRLISKSVFPASLDRVSRVKVERGRDTWFMSRTERGNPDDISDDRYEVNGLEVSQQNFSSVYQKFIGILWEGPASDDVDLESPEIRITVSGVLPDAPNRTIRFRPYNEKYYLASVEDAPLEFVAGRHQVTDFIEDLAALAEHTG